jgi:hypothetical protein
MSEIMHLFGTSDEVHIHLGSIRIISNAQKIHFGVLNKTFFQPSNSIFFYSAAACFSLLVLSLG